MFPNKFISPVIAISFLIFLFVNKLYITRVIAVPADGPSLGVDPSGQCTCIACLLKLISLLLLFS